MSAQDAWLKSIKFFLDNWGKIVIVITAIAGYITGGVNYVGNVEKTNELAELRKTIEALDIDHIQVVLPKQATGISRQACQAIVDKALVHHLDSRSH